jgi:hypothetical protein
MVKPLDELWIQPSSILILCNFKREFIIIIIIDAILLADPYLGIDNAKM